MKLTVTYGVTPGFAVASVVAAILLSAVGALPANSTPVTQTVAPGTESATFDSLAVDTWTFTATPVDVNGNPLTAAGYTPPSTAFTVTGTGPVTVSLQVPTALVASAS